MELRFLHVLPPVFDCVHTISGICARQSGQTPPAQRRVRPRTRVEQAEGAELALCTEAVYTNPKRTDHATKRDPRMATFYHTPPSKSRKIFSRIMRAYIASARERCTAFCQGGKCDFSHFRRFSHFLQQPQNSNVNKIYLLDSKSARY